MIRRSLFWKIFLSFWVSMLLFGICSALIDNKIRQSERDSRYTPVSVIIKRSYQLIKKDRDKTVLKGWLLESQDRIHSNTVYILDSNGLDLLNCPLNARIQQALNESASEPQEITPYLQAADAIFFDSYALQSNNI